MVPSTLWRNIPVPTLVARFFFFYKRQLCYVHMIARSRASSLVKSIHKTANVHMRGGSERDARIRAVPRDDVDNSITLSSCSCLLRSCTACGSARSHELSFKNGFSHPGWGKSLTDKKQSRYNSCCKVQCCLNDISVATKHFYITRIFL